MAGNTRESWADRNNRVLGELCGYDGRYLRGVQAGDVPDRIDRAGDLWGDGPVCFLALGPSGKPWHLFLRDLPSVE